jgi:hypothetical protein
MSTTRRWTIIPAVTLAIAMTACGSDEDTADTSTTVAAASSSSPGATETTAPTEATSATLPAEPVDTTGDTTAPGEVVITATVGVDTGEDRIEEIPLGSNVTLTITDPSNDDEFHVHGYDLGDGEEVLAGEPKTFSFTADKAGEWEVESHSTDEVLLILKVG